jgi:hypothetical protein
MVESGVRPNRLIRTTTVEQVADKLVEAIRRDCPEVVESGAPIRPTLALAQLVPQLGQRVPPRLGVTELFRRAAVARGRAD